MHRLVLALRAQVRSHVLLLDVLLGVVVTVLSAVTMASRPPFMTYEFRELDALGLLLAVVAGAAVTVRSRWTLTAFVVSGVASLLPVVLGDHQTLGGLPVLLTLYTVAVVRDGRTSGTALVTVNLGVAVALLVGPFEPTAADWVANTLVLLTGWTLGRSVRGRRAHAAGLEERNRALLAAQDSETRALLTDERSRIAGEMQDLVAHSLTAVTVQTAAARRLVRSDPETASRLLTDVERDSRNAMEEMRRILEVLRPAVEQTQLRPQPGLEDLDHLLAQARADGRDVALSSSGEPVPLPPGVSLAAYRLVQEALDNARRHAGPAQVRVQLAWDRDQLSVDVEDDGRGALVGSTGTGQGRGLQAVRERVAAYGGRLRAGPRGGGGFAVTATLPTGRDAS